jgi:tRNA G18 (ribose-2'-O)-methylase SpoU
MREALGDAWDGKGHIAEDPNLRGAIGRLPRAPIRLIVCPLTKDINQGGLLRLAESMRLERVEFTPEGDRAMDMAGHRGTQHRQPWQWLDADRAVEQAAAEGYVPIALSLSSRAQNYATFRWPFPMALVVGSELSGVPDEIEALCAATVAIPMYGLVTSHNVAVATGIVLSRAHAAYVESHPEFEPARNASRQLLGLPPATYEDGSA